MVIATTTKLICHTVFLATCMPSFYMKFNSMFYIGATVI